MTIALGTAACEATTVAGLVFDEVSDNYSLDVIADNEAMIKGFSFAVAKGIYDGLYTQIADGESIVRDGATLAGGAGGGGGGAPIGAHYLTSQSDGTLTTEHIVSDTASVIWTFSSGSATASVPDATTSAKGIVELAMDGEASAGVVVQGNDSRLAQATTTARGTVELATSAETTAGLAVQASDSRLSDARTPTTHASMHEAGGAGQISVTNLSGLLADAQTPLFARIITAGYIP